MQRTCALLIFIACHSFSFGQCETCYSLEEALLQPEKVQSLTLRANSLTELPPEVRQLVNLKKLDLSMNLLLEFNPEAFQLPGLEELNLSQNPGIFVLDLEGIGQSLPMLKSLDLSRNQIRHLGLGIAELEQLQVLNLAHNHIEFMPSTISALTALTTLDASHNKLKDALWLNACWALETLHIQHNPDVNLNALGLSLLEKDHLSSIQLTPNEKCVPAIFAELPIKELHLTGGSIAALNGKLRFADSLESLIVEDCKLPKPKTFFESLNTCTNIDAVEFIGMEIPGEIVLMKQVDDLYFDACTFAEVSALRSIKPQIDIHAVDCDIESEDFIGNSRIARAVRVERQQISDEMQSNRVESIVSPEIQTRRVNATEPSVIDLGFSTYEIPANAFLRPDGSVYEGSVELMIKEYNDPIISALDGVPMVYQNGETNEIFASSGMIEFRAYDANGEELQPNPSNLINVTLQDVQPATDNRLYVFNETSNSWQDIGRPVSTNWDSLRIAFMDSLNRLPDSLFFNYRTVYPNFVMNYKKQRRSPDELSFFAHNMTRFDKQFYKVPGSVVGVSGHNQLWIGKHKIWMIDTTLTQDQRDQLSVIAQYRKRHDKFWKYARKTGNAKLIPRVIYNLSLTPNLENDNYTLRFMFKDQVVQLPVYESWESSVGRTQLRERKMDKAYGKSMRQASKEENYIAAHVDELEKITIAQNKERIVEILISARKYQGWRDSIYRENLRFGLASFGLMNCDRFRRSSPPSYFALGRKLKDQDGQDVEVPEMVRFVALAENAYMEIPSNRIPFAPSLDVRICFRVGEDEIAVAKLVRPNEDMPVLRFKTSDYTPDEIYSIIRRL